MGPWHSDLPMGLPEGPPARLQEIDLALLTDGELAKLARYRDWLLADTPPGHREFAAAKRRVEAVESEKAARKRLRAAERGHDPSLCEHPLRCCALG